MAGILPHVCDRRSDDARWKPSSYIDYVNRAASRYNQEVKDYWWQFPQWYRFVTFADYVEMDPMGVQPIGRGILKYADSLRLAVEAELRWRPRGEMENNLANKYQFQFLLSIQMPCKQMQNLQT